MPTNTEVLLSFGVDEKSLTKAINSVAKALRTGIQDYFTKNPIKFPTIDARDFKFKNKFDLSQLEYKGFIKIPADRIKIDGKIDLSNIAVTGKVASPTTGTTTTTTGSTTSKFTPNRAAIVINPQEIKATEQALSQLQARLRSQGLVDKEAIKQTQELTSSLNKVAQGYHNIELAQRARVAQGGSGNPTEQEAKRLGVLDQRLKDVRDKLAAYNIESAKSHVATERSTAFMDSFGFKVGILGFSLGILGGHLQRLTQNLVQFVTTSATAVEPLERIKNLVVQLVDAGEIPTDQKNTIFDEINRLSDLPGSNLESVTEGFRKLLVVTQNVQQSLKLVEQLTKATGRSGTGARGLGQLVFQLAQFAESGDLTQRDIKTIKEQGGADISKIVSRLGGKEGIQEMGAASFFNELIKGLEKVPAPLEAAQDKLNKINNSLIRMRLNILEILKPGLDDLLKALQRIEGLVENLKERFDNLSPESKRFFGNLIISGTAFLGVLSGVLTLLAGVGIALAGGKHLIEAYGVAISAIATKTNIGAFFSLLKTEGLAAFTLLNLSVTGIARGLATILGFTGPLGIILNLILALVFNLGHARDVTLAALSDLGEAFTNLFSKLTEFFNGPAGKSILSFIDAIYNLLGGLLGGVLAGLIEALTGFINLIAEFFGLLSNPSTEGLSKFAAALEQATIGWAAKMGKLIAASLFDAMAELIPESSGAPGPSDVIFGGLNRVGAHNFRRIAKELRDDVAGSVGVSAGLKDNLTESQKQTSAMLQNLKDSEKLMGDLSKSANDLAISFAKIQTNLTLSEIKFQADLQLAAQKDEFDRLIRANPFEAQRQLSGFLSQQTQTSIGAASAATANEIKELSAELERSFKVINRFPTDTLANVFNLGDVSKLRDSLKTINDSAKSGSTDVEAYGRAIKTVQAATEALTGQGLKDREGFPLNLSEKDKKAVEDFNAALKETGQNVEKLNGILGKRTSEEQQIAHARIKAQEEYARQIKEVIKQLEALERVRSIKSELEALNQSLAKQEELLSAAQETGNLEQSNRINENILVIKNQIADKESQIARAGLANRDIVKETEIINERELKRLQLSNEALKRKHDLMLAISKQNAEIAKQGFSDVANLLSRLNEQNSARISLGLNPLGITDENRTQLIDFREQITNLLNLNLGKRGSSLKTPLEVALENIVNQLLLGTGNVEDFDQALENMADSVRHEFDELSFRRADLENTLAAARRGDNVGFTIEQLEKQQAELNRKTAEYATLLKIINLIYAQRAITISNEFKAANQLLQVEKARLEIEQKRLSLEADLADRKAENIKLRGEQPGGIPGDDALNRAQQLQSELNLIKNRYEAEVNGIEQARLASLERARQNKATADEIKAINDAYDVQLNLLRLINDQDVENAQLRATTNAINNLRDAVERLTSVGATFGKFVDDLRAYIAKLTKDGKPLVDFKDLLIDAALAIGAAFATAITESISNGESFLTTLRKFMGQLLIQVGQMLVQLGTASLALAALAFFFPGITPPQWALGTPAALAAIAAGTALIVVGSLLGGGSQSTQTANKNATNTANSQTGATGTGFDPNKDIKTAYARELSATILLDIRTDNSQIIKVITKEVNGNGRLATLISNRKLGFVM